ncbi:hypothetical protein HK100_005962 [Physocladia obscura]|uniref:Uncharacterized protein n=1 Tax=Physocladia obscura TaxID=109957 RepID=A0AAD5TBE2_9FUNG|nr:hypothetical protein HK100_005962 [Physocladia obscura]
MPEVSANRPRRFPLANHTNAAHSRRIPIPRLAVRFGVIDNNTSNEFDASNTNTNNESNTANISSNSDFNLSAAASSSAAITGLDEINRSPSPSASASTNFQTRTIRPIAVNELESIASSFDSLVLPAVVATMDLRYSDPECIYFDEEMPLEMEGLIELFLESQLEEFTLQDEHIQLTWKSVRSRHPPMFSFDWSWKATQVPWKIIVTHFNKRDTDSHFLPVYTPGYSPIVSVLGEENVEERRENENSNSMELSAVERRLESRPPSYKSQVLINSSK